MIERIKQHLARGEFVQAAGLGRGQYLVEDAAPEVRAEAALLAAEASHQLRSWFEAGDLARRALAIAEEIGRIDLQGQAHFRICGALTSVGDYRAAVSAGEVFMAGLVDRWPFLEARGGPCLANIGMAQKGLGRVPESLQAFWQALKRFEATEDVSSQVKVRQLMAWQLVDQGDCEEAETHLIACQDLLSGGAAEYLQVHQLTHMAYLRVREDRHGDAFMLAQEVLAPGRQDVHPPSRAVAYYVLGICALQTGQIETAHLLWQLGMDEAATGGVPAIMNLLSRLGNTIRAQQSGQPEGD